MKQKTFELIGDTVEAGSKPIKGWTVGVPVEKEAIAQLKNIAALPFIYSHIAVMPDVHLGKGATVGSVVATKGAIIPAAVGVDIGCVDKETEFLSPDGWKRIDQWNGEQVLQYDEQTGVANWVIPQAYIRKPATTFFHLKTKYGIDQMLSPDHRVFYRGTSRIKGAGQLKIATAQEVYDRHENNILGWGGTFLTSFNLAAQKSGIGLTDEEIRVMVMVMADGSFNSSGISNLCTLRFRKERKIAKALQLLTEAEIDYRYHVSEEAAGDTTVIRFEAPLREKTMEVFWAANPDQLRIIADEALDWDGTRDLNVYFTRDKTSADFMQYAMSASGARARLLVDNRQDGGIDYRVFANPNTEVGLKATPKGNIKVIDATGEEQFCFTVPTGLWVMRRNGCVVITGNCGMAAQRLTFKSTALPTSLGHLRAVIEASVPHGRTDNGGANDRGAFGKVQVFTHYSQAIRDEAEKLRKHLDRIVERHPKLAKAAQRAWNHVGTLGTGNHFIELCLDESDQVWVMLHSGSRGIGNAIGTYFITKAKEEMKRFFIHLPDGDLAYLPEGSQYYNDYIEAVSWAQRFAALNRSIMMHATLGAIHKTLGLPVDSDMSAINCHHNYVSEERHFGQNVLVTRKGAVNAEKGTLGIIPGSMGAKSFIVRGKGHRESFCSCSHGAGRVMSRTQAAKTFTLEDHIRDTAGVECRKDIAVIDETPKAYKNIEDVMSAQEELVEVVHTLKQILCVKG
ncbi:RNA-splicing ligase RtcB [compost metagenome]